MVQKCYLLKQLAGGWGRPFWPSPQPDFARRVPSCCPFSPSRTPPPLYPVPCRPLFLASPLSFLLHPIRRCPPPASPLSSSYILLPASSPFRRSSVLLPPSTSPALLCPRGVSFVRPFASLLSPPASRPPRLSSYRLPPFRPFRLPPSHLPSLFCHPFFVSHPSPCDQAP